MDEYLKTAVKSSDDDDFDEDEEEKEEGATRKMKLSNFQQLLCGFKPKLAEAMDNNHDAIQEAINKQGNILKAIFN